MKPEKSIFIDCEWNEKRKIFIFGCCFDEKIVYQLYGKFLTRTNVENFLSGVGTIYFFGPDIAILEKNFKINLRENYQCVNLLSMIQKIAPEQNSYKLHELEKSAGVTRKITQYKDNIWFLIDDWLSKSKTKRKRCLYYNAEDVINLHHVKKWFFAKYKVKNADISEFRLT
jgi:uncharacterized protein YprB with RNaseH-like and TPR domain